MLLLDVGNSRIKWRLDVNGEFCESGAELHDKNKLEQQLLIWFGDMPVQERVVICAVVTNQLQKQIADWFRQQWLCTVDFVESARYLAGVRNGYTDSEALGVDRWLAIVAAFNAYEMAVCVIDCGTAVTLDVVDAAGQHQGGMIMPGLSMMQKALVQGAAAIEEKQGQYQQLAKNTADGVISGCLGLMVAGLAGIYRQILQEYGGNLKCIVTGGDGELVAEKMGCDCEYIGDLVLQGVMIAAQE